MKKLFTVSSLLLITAVSATAQGNIQLYPNGGNVCNPMQISTVISGNSFNPVSYIWNTGETTSTINITTSGTYTLSVTGYTGNSGNLTTLVRTATYNVLPVPQITPLTNTWVCKGDTVKLAATAGYDFINWSNGASGVLFKKKMNSPGTPGVPSLDTLSVFYTASIDKVCSSTSETIVLRSIRKPHGVGINYQGRMNIKTTDSIPAGLVLEYLFPVTYEMVFTEIANPLNSIKYVTLPGSRKAPASMFAPGASYSVVTTPVINGVKYCPGMACTIGLAAPSGNRLEFNNAEEESLQTYRVFDAQGKMLMEVQGYDFNKEWLSGFTPQLFIIQRSGKIIENFKIQLVN